MRSVALFGGIDNVIYYAIRRRSDKASIGEGYDVFFRISLAALFF